MSNFNENVGFDTKSIHAGQEYDQWSHNEIVPPIVTSVNYYQNEPTDDGGYSYSRAANPTRDVLEKCLATLDSAKYGVVFSSGCGATTAVLHLLKTGDHMISGSETYGGTRTLFSHFTTSLGIEIDFVDSTNVNLIKNAIKPNTRLIWIETPTNPCLKVSDISAIAEVAHSRNGIIFAVDNTFLTPYFQRPLELGADIVAYSLTKYMNGHNDVLAGAVVTNNVNIFNDLKYIQGRYGLIVSPFDCYLINRGLKTLPLRMQKHCENSTAVAQYLEKHPKVVKVVHTALPSHPQSEVTRKQSTGHCGMLLIQLNGTIVEAKRFVLSLRLFLSSDSLGSFTSFAVLPAFQSHVSVAKHVKEQLGIFDSTVRLSVGLEIIEDLVKDLEQALQKAFE